MSKKRKAPSRERYEEHRPVLAFRAGAEEKERLEAEAASLGMSVGEYLRQRAGLSNAHAARAMPSGGLGESLRKIEIKTILSATRRTLTGPQWAPFQTVVEYTSAVSQIEYLETKTMDLPLSDLESALPQVLKRAAEATGLQTLNERIGTVQARLNDLEARRSDLCGEVGQLETERAELGDQIANRRATLKAIEGDIQKAKRETGMTESEILRSLKDFGTFRSTASWLEGRVTDLSWRAQNLSNQCARLQSDAQGWSNEIGRLQRMRVSWFDELADRFTLEDYTLLGSRMMKRWPMGHASPEAQWIWNLLTGQAAFVRKPRLDAKGAPVHGTGGAIVYETFLVTLSPGDRTRLRELVHQASLEGEGPHHALGRMTSGTVEALPKLTEGQFEQNMELIGESMRRTKAAMDGLQMIKEIEEGKRGQFTVVRS